MTARILIPATLSVFFCGVLPARAADPQLVALVMPDAKVLAGVNVEQAKATPFGQYVLNQVQSTQDQHLQELTAKTGFDPRRDVRELLVASTGDQQNHTGLVLARGNFDLAKIAAAAGEGGAVTETYNGVIILEDPKKANGVAFLDNSLAVAGDLASVKGAIDRQKVPQAIPSSLAVLVNQWSTTQDAWAVSIVPLSTLKPPSTAPNVPGLNGQGAFQAVQQAAGGVKFGNEVVLKGQAQADTAQNAQAMADALKLLVNLVQMQAAKEPVAASLAQAVQIGASGNLLNVSLSVPEDQLQQILHPKVSPNSRPGPRRVERKM